VGVRGAASEAPEPGLARPLTLKQHALLSFVRTYFDEHRRSPLIREIQLGCDIASYKSAIDRLNALERKGLIRRVPNKHRGIRLVRKPEARAAAKPAHAAAEPSLEGAGEGAVSA
jgi:repressor LexA